MLWTKPTKAFIFRIHFIFFLQIFFWKTWTCFFPISLTLPPLVSFVSFLMISHSIILLNSAFTIPDHLLLSMHNMKDRMQGMGTRSIARLPPTGYVFKYLSLINIPSEFRLFHQGNFPTKKNSLFIFYLSHSQSKIPDVLILLFHAKDIFFRSKLRSMYTESFEAKSKCIKKFSNYKQYIVIFEY